MLGSKLSTALLLVLSIQLATSADAPWQRVIDTITYGPDVASCYSTCKRGQFCTIKGGVTTCKAYCGDGIVVGNETGPNGCDDGNQLPGDGCNKCSVEPLWSCKVLFDGIPSVCSFTCGNGILQTTSFEQCDDGNRRNGDGCTSNCAKVASYSCPTPGSPCTTVCGDGVINGGEECDDGNSASGDGCDLTCKVQKLYGCSGTPSKCVNKCGNAILDINSGQICDNGKSASEDGCSDDCQTINLGWTCNNIPGSNTKCTPVCGDGLLRGIELTAGKCDDGNLIANDGCSAICVVNPGFTCTGTPSLCTPICGDGKLAGYQTTARYCDDSNTRINDGCVNCLTQRLFSCTGAPSICVNLCGNKRWNPAVYEDCDNGNSTVEDGCSNTCQIQEGWECPGGAEFALSVCNPVCGDKVMKGAETCDDGNKVSGDGCSAKCAVEAGYNCAAKKGDGSSNCVKV